MAPTTPSTSPSLLASRYRPLGADGSVIEDITTGLHWMRCGQGPHWNGVTCDGAASKLTWEEAMWQHRGFSYAGYADWRVPTKDELLTLVYCSSGQPTTWNDTHNACEGDYESPTIDQVAFPKTEVGYIGFFGFFWSSSPSAYGSDRALYVDFNDGCGMDSYKGNDGQVRLVRGGQ